MRVLTVLGLALACLPALGQAQSQISSQGAALLQQGLITTADEFILPAYAAQADATSDLRQALEHYCADGGEIDAVRASFADAFLAWQRAAIVYAGPIKEAEGPMRVQLWPDPKGFARRAVLAAERAEDPALLAQGGLQGRSIALTNLTALEQLVHADLSPASYACDLAHAIAAFQAELATDLVAGWTPGSDFRRAYDSAADGNDLYPSVDALIREVMGGAVVYVDRLRKFKLLRGMGDAPGAARPERTEARVSGLGLESIVVSFRTLADFYDTPFGVFDMASELGGSMEFFVLADTAGSIADTLAFQPLTLEEIAAQDGPEAAALRGYADTVLFHERFLKTGFTDAIGLTAGFTAADGD